MLGLCYLYVRCLLGVPSKPDSSNFLKIKQLQFTNVRYYGKTIRVQKYSLGISTLFQWRLSASRKVPALSGLSAEVCWATKRPCHLSYYRYHHGDNKLSPKQQADIMAILAQYGNTDGLAFDHYETVWDFDWQDVLKQQKAPEFGSLLLFLINIYQVSSSEHLLQNNLGRK